MTRGLYNERLFRRCGEIDAGRLSITLYGIGQARRGWREAADVLNTRPLEALRGLSKRG